MLERLKNKLKEGLIGFFWKHEQFHIIPRLGIFIEPVGKYWWISIDLSWLVWSVSLNIRFVKPLNKQKNDTKS